MNQLSIKEQAKIVQCLCEGVSGRATARITGRAFNTIQRTAREIGAACAIHHDKAVRGLDCQRVQMHEIWSFVGCKAKNKPNDEVSERGDSWLWTALDADSKLMVAYLVGDREIDAARDFLSDLHSRMAHRAQITSDGHRSYKPAMREVFGKEVDYAMLIKIFAETDGFPAARRYSPPKCCGTKPLRMIGQPDYRHISTSFVERQNLTIRMTNRRFTRLTNAFSKKLENHILAINLNFTHYNFCRPHLTFKADGKVTPAMKAGLTDHVWSIEEMIERVFWTANCSERNISANSK